MSKRFNGWMIVFVLLLVGAAYYRLKYAGEGGMVPFTELRRITELGFNNIMLDYAAKAVPFMIVGFFLPLAFVTIDRVYKALVAGAVIGALLFLVKLFAPDVSADTGESILTMTGVAMGFSLLAILDSLFHKKQNIRYPKKTGIASAFVILLAYLFCMVVLFIEDGQEFVRLNIFAPDQALPQQISCTADLDRATGQAMTYRSIRVQPGEEIARLSGLLGMQGKVDKKDDSAVLNVQGKELSVFAAGNWSYYNEVAAGANAGKEAPGEAFAKEKATEAVKKLTNGSNTLRLVSVERSETDASASVGFETYLDEHRVRGSGEITMTIGADGALISVQKISADFAAYKKVPVISPREAWEIVLKGGVAHTLFEPAKSAVVTNCSLAYWQEEVKGYLQPIWLFAGQAETESGEKRMFEIFIPAMR